MSDTVYYIGLDPAEKTGVCLWNPLTHEAIVDVAKGGPLQQLTYLTNMMRCLPTEGRYVWCYEELHHMRNAHTTKLLSERIGYLKYTLLHRGYRVEAVQTNSARAWLGVKDKEGVRKAMQKRCDQFNISEDEADAALVAIYQSHLDGILVNYYGAVIKQKKGIV